MTEIAKRRITQHKPSLMKTIAIINQKGGVGKTTSTVNIGTGLNRLGKRVLLIDLDPQAHLTYSLGIPAHTLERSIYDLLKGNTTAEAVFIERSEGLKVIPSNLNLSGAEMEFINSPGREFLLRDVLNDLKGFDYVLMDLPPSLGLLTVNALAYAREIYIPLQTEFLALQGLSKLLETVEVVKKRLNKELDITGIIATRFDKRKILNREVLQKIKGHFGSKVFKTVIRENIALAEAPGWGQDIFTYKSHSHGAEDYLNLCKEIIKRV